MIREAIHRYTIRPIKRSLEPYVRMGYDGLTSNKTQRVALNTAIFGVVFGGLLSTALLIYGIFYFLYIPKVSHVIPVYMQYGVPGETIQPAAYVDFTGGSLRQQSAYLTPEQHYDLGLELFLPDSHENFDMGNFMVHIDLQTKENRTTASSSRPALVNYRTPLLRTMLTIWKGVPLVLGLTREAQTVKVPLLEKYEETEAYPIHHALIRLSDNRLRLYETKLHVDANFQGLRFFMYHWKLTTASVFITGIMFWETVLCFLAWRLFLSLFKDKEEETESLAGSNGEEEMGVLGPDGKFKRPGEESGLPSDDQTGSAEEEDDGIYMAPTSVVHTASNLPESPRSMSSAPSYHSAAPLGSPPEYGAHAPPSLGDSEALEIDIDSHPPYLGGSAYPYAFPFQSAGNSGRSSPYGVRAAVPDRRSRVQSVPMGSSSPSAGLPGSYGDTAAPMLFHQRTTSVNLTAGLSQVRIAEGSSAPVPRVVQDLEDAALLQSSELRTLAAIRDASPGSRESYPPGLRQRRRITGEEPALIGGVVYEAIVKDGAIDVPDIDRGAASAAGIDMDHDVPVFSAAAEDSVEGTEDDASSVLMHDSSSGDREGEDMVAVEGGREDISVGQSDAQVDEPEERSDTRKGGWFVVRSRGEGSNG